MPFIQEIDSKIKELRKTKSNLDNEYMLLEATYRKKRDESKEMNEKVRMLLVSFYINGFKYFI